MVNRNNRVPAVPGGTVVRLFLLCPKDRSVSQKGESFPI
jgi:hypothetical protein